MKLLFVCQARRTWTLSAAAVSLRAGAERNMKYLMFVRHTVCRDPPPLSDHWYCYPAVTSRVPTSCGLDLRDEYLRAASVMMWSDDDADEGCCVCVFLLFFRPTWLAAYGTATDTWVGGAPRRSWFTSPPMIPRWALTPALQHITFRTYWAHHIRMHSVLFALGREDNIFIIQLLYEIRVLP